MKAKELTLEEIAKLLPNNLCQNISISIEAKCKELDLHSNFSDGLLDYHDSHSINFRFVKMPSGKYTITSINYPICPSIVLPDIKNFME